MKILLAGFVGMLMSLGLFLAPVSAQFEAAKNQACKGIQFTDETGTECDESQDEKVDNVVATVINILSLVVGVISVIMVVIGGIKYTLSQGDSNSTASAKNTVIYAIVGLVIVLLAQLIVMFVINRATSDPLPSNNTEDTINDCNPRQADEGICDL